MILVPNIYYRLHTKFLQYLMIVTKAGVSSSIYLFRWLIEFGYRFTFQFGTKWNIRRNNYLNKSFFELQKTESCIEQLAIVMSRSQSRPSPRINSCSSTIFTLQWGFTYSFEFKRAMKSCLTHYLYMVIIFSIRVYLSQRFPPFILGE